MANIDIADKFTDFIFSEDNRKYLLLLLIIGFLLRTLIALRFNFAADEMVHAGHAIGFIESGKLQIMDQNAIWFFLTDLSTKIFGVTIFGVRFLQILSDTLLIILVYLLGKEIFNKKIALIASIIFAFSSFQMVQMKALMDVPMAFFSLFALYFLVRFLKTNKNKFFLFCWISLGIAVMIKSIALWFIPPFILFLLYYNKKHFNKFKIKQIIYAAIIIVLMVMPVLTFNYLLYKDKGIVDLQFARFTKIGFETYEGIAHTIQPFSIERLLFTHDGISPGIVIVVKNLYRFETFLPCLLALLGLYFLFKQKNKFTWLILLSFFFPFIFLSGTSTLINHFVFTIPYISLLSSLSIVKISEKFNKHRKIFLYSILILIILLFLVKVHKEANGFFGKNEIGKLIDFKNKNIEKNSLVIVDSRIYRGRIVLMFWDRHYMETNYFSALSDMEKFPGSTIPIPIYFIEAATDDSGWGTVKDQPEFNQTNEAIVDYFEANSKLIETIIDTEDREHFKIYKTTFAIKQGVLNFADSTHQWFYYPVAYKPKGSNFDDYTTYNAFDSLLDKLAHLMLYLEVLITLFLFFHILYLLYKSS